MHLVGLYSPQSFKDKTDPLLIKDPSDVSYAYEILNNT